MFIGNLTDTGYDCEFDIQKCSITAFYNYFAIAFSTFLPFSQGCGFELLFNHCGKQSS